MNITRDMNKPLLLSILLTTLLLALWGCNKASNNYPPDDTTVKLDSTNLPIVWIEVSGDSIKRDQRIQGRMTIIDNGEGRLNYTDTIEHPHQHIDYQGYIAIRYRGNSTFNNSPKKPYSLRTLDEPMWRGNAKKRKVSLLGMGRDSNWALLAPYADKSLMRDMITRELSRPWMEYSPQGRHCEVIVDGIYYGVYVLSEVVSKGAHRLNLASPGDKGDALTGDYLMEVDCYDEVTYTSRFSPLTSDGRPITSHHILFQYKSPDRQELDREQVRYINSRIDEMEAGIASGKYRHLIDEMSFIDYQLMTELCHNVDGYRLSGKFYKRRDSVDPRFKMVLWDTDLAYGNASHRQAWRTDTWIYQSNDILLREKDVYMVPAWWYWLNNNIHYTSRLKARWAQLRSSYLSDERVSAVIDSLAYTLTSCGAEGRNSQAWPRWGVKVWPNHYIATSHADEVNHIKQWLSQRLQWMDQQLQ